MAAAATAAELQTRNAKKSTGGLKYIVGFCGSRAGQRAHRGWVRGICEILVQHLWLDARPSVAILSTSSSTGATLTAARVCH